MTTGTTSAPANIQAGAGWVVCVTVDKDHKCNTGVSMITAGPVHAAIVGRVHSKVSSAAAYGLGATSDALTNNFTWNADLFLAA